MENSYRFFENRDCEYFPCHDGLEEFNCLFCFCPIYHRRDCPGTPTYIETACGTIKDCSLCTFPHLPENYEAVLELTGE